MQLRAAGNSPEALADILVGIIGQCQAHLEHRGAIDMYGPVKFGGEVRVGGGGAAGPGALIFSGTNAYFNIDNTTGTLSEEVVNNSMASGRIVSIYTLAADLNADASVVVGDKTFVNSFCRDTYKLTSGTTVLGINGGNGTYYIIAWDKCEQPQ